MNSYTDTELATLREQRRRGYAVADKAFRDVFDSETATREAWQEAERVITGRKRRFGYRPAQKAAARAEDERRLNAGEVTAAELNKENSLFGSLDIREVRLAGTDIKLKG